VGFLISKTTPPFNSQDWDFGLSCLKKIWKDDQLPMFVHLYVGKINAGQANDMCDMLISERVMTSDLQQILSRIDTEYEKVVIWMKQI